MSTVTRCKLQQRPRNWESHILKHKKSNTHCRRPEILHTRLDKDAWDISFTSWKHILGEIVLFYFINKNCVYYSSQWLTHSTVLGNTSKGMLLAFASLTRKLLLHKMKQFSFKYSKVTATIFLFFNPLQNNRTTTFMVVDKNDRDHEIC